MLQQHVTSYKLLHTTHTNSIIIIGYEMKNKRLNFGNRFIVLSVESICRCCNKIVASSEQEPGCNREVAIEVWIISNIKPFPLHTMNVAYSTECRKKALLQVNYSEFS